LRIFLEFEVRRVRCRQCGKVKREREHRWLLMGRKTIE
jgi:hypothetical protein